MITEGHRNAHTGLLLDHKTKNPRKNKGWKPEVGESYICKSEDMTESFRGIVVKRYNKAALVIISSNAEIDDYAVRCIFAERKVVSFEKMKPV